ncbi:type II toxin-antitoxin system ParD family antitoxin [Okeania sp. KiyG1]|uniref:type II toxin-antitoxin system ParD family antitoxin n=1 Tax=Okeania sp. KiyG1 TaxID=2720165 RepID=UPI00192491D6|nr:type II toxin-antitoxin system ParD family antitoxin [Okeania sp. KiyG1]GGA23515.1 addiction module antitoxin [Okeania sp. KiyG1]
MNISLSLEAQKFIEEQVNSGRYSSATEVVGEALRLLSDKESIRSKHFVELKEKIRMGIEKLDRGEGIDGEEVFAELEADIKCIETEMKQGIIK